MPFHSVASWIIAQTYGNKKRSPLVNCQNRQISSYLWVQHPEESFCFFSPYILSLYHALSSELTDGNKGSSGEHPIASEPRMKRQIPLVGVWGEEAERTDSKHAPDLMSSGSAQNQEEWLKLREKQVSCVSLAGCGLNWEASWTGLSTPSNGTPKGRQAGLQHLHS